MTLMYTRVDDLWSYRGFRSIVLENDRLRVDIFPELGGKVYNLIHKATGANLLWHNPRIPLRAAPVGASYDDNFCGGWDELFPNDAPGRVGDEAYPDHGELWSQSWDYRTEVTSDAASVYLRCMGAATATLVEKWIELRPGESHLRFRHRITNVGRRPLDFLWKLHPALVIEPGDRLDVPGRIAEVVDPTFGALREPRQFDWPIARAPGEVSRDFSVIRAFDGTRDFLYVRDLDAGWCALRRMQLGVGFGLVFPRNVFQTVWLFMTFGGWRGLETLVLEPCTAIPKDLNEAIRRGTCSHLEPGASLECQIGAVLFDGVDPVREIRPDGSILR